MFVVAHLLGLVGQLRQVQALPEIVKIGERKTKGTNIESTDGVLGKNVFWRLFMPNKNIQEAFLMSATKSTAGRRQHLGKYYFLESYKTVENF